jgi:hypothetical protein
MSGGRVTGSKRVGPAGGQMRVEKTVETIDGLFGDATYPATR